MFIKHNVITFHPVAYHSIFVTDGNVTSKQDNFLPRDAYATRIARIVYMLWPRVRLSVCPKPVCCRNSWMDLFNTESTLGLTYTVPGISKISILPSETLSQTPKLADFFAFFDFSAVSLHNTSVVAMLSTYSSTDESFSSCVYTMHRVAQPVIQPVGQPVVSCIVSEWAIIFVYNTLTVMQSVVWCAGFCATAETCSWNFRPTNMKLMNTAAAVALQFNQSIRIFLKYRYGSLSGTATARTTDSVRLTNTNVK